MKYFESMPNIKEVFELKVSLSAWYWTGASQHSRHHVITRGRQTNCRDPQLLHLQNRRDFFSIYRRRRGESSFPFIGGALAAGGELVGVFSTETLSRAPCPLALSKDQDLFVDLFGTTSTPSVATERGSRTEI